MRFLLLLIIDIKRKKRLEKENIALAIQEKIQMETRPEKCEGFPNEAKGHNYS